MMLKHVFKYYFQFFRREKTAFAVAVPLIIEALYILQPNHKGRLGYIEVVCHFVEVAGTAAKCFVFLAQHYAKRFLILPIKVCL